MNKFINGILGLVLVVFAIMNCVLVNDLEQKTIELVEVYNTEPTLVIVDSLVWDTCYIEKTEIIKLPIYRTDTILLVDSVDVILPISRYEYDTTLSETHISLICEGFDVRLNSLLVETIKTPTIKENKSKKWGIGVGLGITYYNGFKILPTIGINYNLFSF